MKTEVVHAFSQAGQYAHHAQVQWQVAQTLAGALPALQRPVVLELGCGTGFLSQHLLARWPDGWFVLSDIAEPMVQRCRAHVGQRDAVYFAVLDGERPACRPRCCDLVAASMVLQWFDDPLGSLAGLRELLRPGGVLVFATLGPGTFREWRAACAAQGLADGLPFYPTAADWQRAWPAPGVTRVWEEEIAVQHPSGLAFLQALRAIGAHRPVSGYRPHPAGHLRRLLRELRDGFSVTYHVVYGVFSRPQ